jgi:hypothetical protein
MSTVREQAWDAWKSANEAVCALRDHSSKPHVFLAATGAGAGLQALIWNQPGISALLAGAAFPYAARETDELIGYQPDGYCTLDTAVEMAMAGYMRARQNLLALKKEGMPVGVGINAVVATSNEHRGDHRIFCAAVTSYGVTSATVFIRKSSDPNARTIDGQTTDLCGLNALLYAVGLPQVPIANIEVSGNVYYKGDKFILEPHDMNEQQLRTLFFMHPIFGKSGRRYADNTRSVQGNVAFMPGSYNPLHDGHRAMAEEVEHTTKSA